MKRDDRVEKRGLGHRGTVLDCKGNWVSVEWDEGLMVAERPRLCTKGELRLI